MIFFEQLARCQQPFLAMKAEKKTQPFDLKLSKQPNINPLTKKPEFNFFPKTSQLSAAVIEPKPSLT